MFEHVIKIPYDTKPHMKKYEGPIIITPPLETYLLEKQIEYELMGSAIAYESDIAIENNLVEKTIKILNLDLNCNTIISFGLSIQEDISIIHKGKLEAAFVAFPSGWDPAEKQGKTLEELHEPVADGDELRKMSNRLSEILSGKYSYHRYVWSVVPTGMLSMHPRYEYEEPETLNDLWFRLEHQTSIPVVENETFAFFLNVDVLPFVSLLDEDKSQILDSVNSMSDAVLKYKNLEKIKEILNKEIKIY